MFMFRWKEHGLCRTERGLFTQKGCGEPVAVARRSFDLNDAKASSADKAAVTLPVQQRGAGEKVPVISAKRHEKPNDILMTI